MSGGRKRKKFTIHITSTVPAVAPSRKKRQLAETGSEENGDDADGEGVGTSGNGAADLPGPGDVQPVHTGNKCEAIRDVEHFKKRMGFHPVPPVYTDIDTVQADS